MHGIDIGTMAWSLYPAVALGIVAHEAGHWIAARAFGFPVVGWGVTFGEAWLSIVFDGDDRKKIAVKAAGVASEILVCSAALSASWNSFTAALLAVTVASTVFNLALPLPGNDADGIRRAWRRLRSGA